jgi:replicative DNA helicase
MNPNDTSQVLEITEKALFGAAISSPVHLQRICAELHVTDFRPGMPRAFMLAVIDESEESGTIEKLSFASRLEKSNKFKTPVETIDYFLSIASADADIDKHIQIVKEHSVARNKAALTKDILKNPFGPSASLTARIDEQDARLFVKKQSSHIDDIMAQCVTRIQELHDNKIRITGIKTRWPEVNEVTKGLQKKKFIVVAGRPAMGKSLFAQNLAEDSAIAGKPVLIISLEMGKDEYVERMLSSQSNLEMDKIICPADMTQNDFSLLSNGMKRLHGTKLYIEDDGEYTSVRSIRYRAEQIKKLHGEIGVIIVDYLQLMTSTGGENRNQEITEISRELKRLSMDLDVPVVALSQLSRKVEERTDKRPMMSDLRESGAIEQEADVIIFLYRDEYYKKELSEFKGIAEILFEKVRRGKPGTTVHLAFRGAFQRFENLASDMHKPDYGSQTVATPQFGNKQQPIKTSSTGKVRSMQ